MSGQEQIHYYFVSGQSMMQQCVSGSDVDSNTEDTHHVVHMMTKL